MDGCKQLWDLFDSMLPWERAAVVQEMVFKANEYGVELPDDKDDDYDFTECTSAYDAVCDFGAEELLDEIDLEDIVRYFRMRKADWDIVVGMINRGK